LLRAFRHQSFIALGKQHIKLKMYFLAKHYAGQVVVLCLHACVLEGMSHNMSWFDCHSLLFISLKPSSYGKVDETTVTFN